MIVDLFAGCGGWDEGLRQLGRTDVVGFELDRWACATRSAAGHRTIRADVTTWPLAPLVGKVEGLIASPPCPDWSMAGSRKGRDGATGHLVDEPWRWITALNPEWIAMEQVPPALEVWKHYTHRLRELGYSAWAGVLCAADYGVPQTRSRAVLIASRVTAAVSPEPTHARHPGMFPPNGWVPMHAAVGWHGVLDTRRDQRPDGSTQKVHTSRPAPTVTGAAVGQWLLDGEAVPESDIVALQGFPRSYPFQGTKSRRGLQVGNAVPPPLAAAILGALISGSGGCVRDTMTPQRREGEPGVMWPGMVPLTEAEWLRVQANTGLVWAFVNKAQPPEHERDDLYQDGLFGLMRAAQMFDPSAGFQFSTYAYRWIRGMVQKGNEYRNGVNAGRARANGTTYRPPASLDAPSGENDASIADFLPDDDVLPDEAALGSDAFRTVVAALRVSCRDGKDRTIADGLIRGAVLAERVTNRELGERVGLTHERVRQRRAALMERTRDRLDMLAAT